jgi:hypothetical protein
MSRNSKTKHPRTHVDTDVFIIYRYRTLSYVVPNILEKTLYIKIMEKHFILMPESHLCVVIAQP